jgi:hypothetical protein
VARTAFALARLQHRALEVQFLAPTPRFSTTLKVAVRRAVLLVDLRWREHGSEPNARTPGGHEQAASAPQVKNSRGSGTWVTCAGCAMNRGMVACRSSLTA